MIIEVYSYDDIGDFTLIIALAPKIIEITFSSELKTGDVYTWKRSGTPPEESDEVVQADKINLEIVTDKRTFTESDLEMFTEDEKLLVRDSLSEFETLLRDEISPVKEDLKEIQEKLC